MQTLLSRSLQRLQGPRTAEGGTERVRGHINCEMGHLSACAGNTPCAKAKLMRLCWSCCLLSPTALINVSNKC